MPAKQKVTNNTYYNTYKAMPIFHYWLHYDKSGNLSCKE